MKLCHKLEVILKFLAANYVLKWIKLEFDLLLLLTTEVKEASYSCWKLNSTRT